MTERTGLGDMIERIHEDLDQVRQIKKCVSCECLLDVLHAMQTDLERIDLPEATAAGADFQQWFDTGNARRHRCLGCEVCLPTEPYNLFSALLREAAIEQGPSPVSGITQAPDCGCGGT